MGLRKILGAGGDALVSGGYGSDVVTYDASDQGA